MQAARFLQGAFATALAMIVGCSAPEIPSTTSAGPKASSSPANPAERAPAEPAPAEPALPAASAPAEAPPAARIAPDAAASSRKNLANIGNAILNFEADNKLFPRRAIVAADGRPLLSWRVAILPFMGKEALALHLQFRLDEPWDSPHNKALLDQMPAAFDSPMTNAGPGMTNYVAVAGESAVLADDKDIKPGSMTDGAANTVMVVEADKAVPWTSPEDLNWSNDDPKAGLGGLHPKGWFLTCLATGQARFVTTASQPHEIRGFFTRNGGDPVDWARQPDP